MLNGVLIAESLRAGAVLGDLGVTVTAILRVRPGGTTDDQPDLWTLIDFSAGDGEVDRLASAFAEVLDEPGWYVDFRTDAETFVIFAGRVFRYPRGDAAGRAAAQRHGRALGVPEAQLDWPV